MISRISDKQDYRNLISAVQISKKIISKLIDQVIEGNCPNEINNLAGKLLKEHSCTPAFLGVKGPLKPFPGNLCVCVNEEVLHAVPFSKRLFQLGDIVKIDFGIFSNNMYTDHCVTKIVGKAMDSEHLRLVNSSVASVEAGISQAIASNFVGDISNALQTVCELAGFDYVKNYCGHGIGKYLHMSPEILPFGKKGTGAKLEEGMVITIENQLCNGSADLELDKSDGWTLRTKDKSLSAMTEHMVIVRKHKAEVLTIL